MADFVEDRYRKGDSDRALCDALESVAGTQLDPSVVWAAITLIRANAMPTVSTQEEMKV